MWIIMTNFDTTDHDILISSEEWQQMETEDGDILLIHFYNVKKKIDETKWPVRRED